MQSVPWGKAGNANLRGKRTMLANCKCCEFVNLRDPYRVKLAEQEMREELPGF